MPTYVYECRTCQEVFEIEQRITEDPLSDCRCGAKGALRRVIQPVGVVFNGPGFHINDYRTETTSTTKPGPAKTESPADSPKSESPKIESPATPE